MKKTVVPEPQFVALDHEGKESDMSILDKEDIAYDPTKVTLDLTKAEKRRTTALMLSIQAYQHMIIKDAEMYLAISHEHERKSLPPIKPATMDAIVEAAINFDDFISGELQRRIDAEPDKETVSEKA